MFAVTILAGAAVVLGCGSGGSGESGAADVCSAVGRKAKECNGAADETTVVADCEDRLGTIAPKLRASALSSIESCVQASDCAHVSTAIADCVDTARATIAPSPAATRLCTDAVQADMKCSSTTFSDQASCLDAAKVFADGALEAADQCMSHSCANIAACVRATLGTLPSGTPVSSNSGGTTSASPSPTESCQPYLDTTTACGACIQRNCCAQAATCFGEASCTACVKRGTCSNDAATTNFNGCIASACGGPCHA